MSGSILDSDYDVKASIAVTSPYKSLPTLIKQSVGDSKDLIGATPCVTDPAPSLNPIITTLIDGPNEALINKLLESLESLKSKEARADSGSDSPSPLTVSTGGSADPFPSSPTEYDFSPSGPLSREQAHHATRWGPLNAAAQQTAPSGQMFQFANAAPFFPSNTTGLNLSNHQNPYYQQQTHPQHGYAAATDYMASAEQVATYQALYCTQLAAAQQQAQLYRMLSPSPPLYEECLVGLEGNYQNYCRQIISEELNVAALRMLAHVKAAQQADPPALTRIIGKRYFCSLKEVSKVVTGSRMLLIAPDVRPSATAHIKPVRLLQMVIAAAEAARVPYAFCLSRRGIGQAFGRDKSMSIVAVMHIDGVENEYVTLLEEAARGRELYALHRDTPAHSTVHGTYPSASLQQQRY